MAVDWAGVAAVCDSRVAEDVVLGDIDPLDGIRVALHVGGIGTSRLVAVTFGMSCLRQGNEA